MSEYYVAVKVIKARLEYYRNLKTYTDCEEYRREGAVGVLENLLEDFKTDKA